jgi:regulatory protein
LKRRRKQRSLQSNFFSSDADEKQVEAARKIALRLLTRAMRTRRDIEDKLASRGFSESVVASVSERLESVGLIDDAEYAGAFLRTNLRLRPRSYRLLRSDLIKKGVSSELANSAVRESSQTVPETSIAREVLTKAFHRYGKLPDRERRRKLFSFMARRGFSLETISEVLEEGEQGV